MFYKIFFCIVIIYLLNSSLKFDDTDKNIFHRSDLKLHIDNRTGCHYLSTWTGQIIPRLDKDGKQICEKRKTNLLD